MCEVAGVLQGSHCDYLTGCRCFHLNKSQSRLNLRNSMKTWSNISLRRLAISLCVEAMLVQSNRW